MGDHLGTCPDISVTIDSLASGTVEERRRSSSRSSMMVISDSSAYCHNCCGPGRELVREEAPEGPHPGGNCGGGDRLAPLHLGQGAEGCGLSEPRRRGEFAPDDEANDRVDEQVAHGRPFLCQDVGKNGIGRGQGRKMGYGRRTAGPLRPLRPLRKKL